MTRLDVINNNIKVLKNPELAKEILKNAAELAELARYKEFVSELAANKDGKTFFNSGKDHASVVMSNIFKYSNNTIRMHSGNLNGDVCKDSDYISNLDNFLAHDNTKLYLSLDQYDDKKMNREIYTLLKFYQRNYTSKVIVKTTKGYFIDNDTRQKTHFIVGDDSMYRLEYNTSDYQARCSFSNEEDCKVLINLFDTLFNNPNQATDLILN